MSTETHHYWIHHWLPEDKISFRREVCRNTIVDGKITAKDTMDVSGMYAVRSLIFPANEWHSRGDAAPAQPRNPGTAIYLSLEELVEALLNEWDQDLEAKVQRARHNWEKVRAATMKLI